MPATSNICYRCGREGRGTDIHIGSWSYHLFEDYSTAELREVGIRDFADVIDENNSCLFCWHEASEPSQKDEVEKAAAWKELAAEREDWFAKKNSATWSPTKQETEKGILRSGWLEKRGAVNTAFQKRFFRLTNNKLEYFKSESGSARGFIATSGSTVKFTEDGNDLATLLISSPTQSREFVLRSNIRTALEWKAALLKAIDNSS